MILENWSYENLFIIDYWLQFSCCIQNRSTTFWKWFFNHIYLTSYKFELTKYGTWHCTYSNFFLNRVNLCSKAIKKPQISFFFYSISCITVQSVIMFPRTALTEETKICQSFSSIVNAFLLENALFLRTRHNHTYM